MPSCTSDLTSAAAALKQQHPSSFGDSGNASTQAFGLFVFAYSCGTCVGPTVAGIIKAKLSWGAATAILAAACAGATVPIVSVFFSFSGVGVERRERVFDDEDYMMMLMGTLLTPFPFSHYHQILKTPTGSRKSRGVAL